MRRYVAREPGRHQLVLQARSAQNHPLADVEVEVETDGKQTLLPALGSVSWLSSSATSAT